MMITAQQNDQELAVLRSDLMRAAGSAQEAATAMPVMTIDWFGPASETWRRTANMYRSRLLRLLDDAERARWLAERIGT